MLRRPGIEMQRLRTPNHPSLATLCSMLAAATVALAALSGCVSDDAGTCCKGLNAEATAKIPEPDPNGGDRVRQDPKFDCSGLTCVSTAGSPTYCTHPCRDDGDCPDGMACAPVLQSDPGPGTQLTPEDKFCVSATPVCGTEDE